MNELSPKKQRYGTCLFLIRFVYLMFFTLNERKRQLFVSPKKQRYCTCISLRLVVSNVKWTSYPLKATFPHLRLGEVQRVGQLHPLRRTQIALCIEPLLQPRQLVVSNASYLLVYLMFLTLNE